MVKAKKGGFMERQKKILLVTADEDLVTLFRKALYRYDVILSWEDNYNNVIQTLQQEKFDLLVADYFLHADGNEEAFDSFTLEITTLENDIRLLTILRDDLIWLRSLILEKNKEKLFPLGNRISIESELLGTPTAFLLNFVSPIVDECDMREHMESIAIYYCKYGRHVFYSPIGFKEKVVLQFVKEDIVDVMKIQKTY